MPGAERADRGQGARDAVDVPGFRVVPAEAPAVGTREAHSVNRCSRDIWSGAFTWLYAEPIVWP